MIGAKASHLLRVYDWNLKVKQYLDEYLRGRALSVKLPKEYHISKTLEILKSLNSLLILV